MCALRNLKMVLMPRQSLLKKLVSTDLLTVPTLKELLTPYASKYQPLVFEEAQFRH
jgi:hypothetical protein